MRLTPCNAMSDQLAQLREQIDATDREILQALARRCALVEQAAAAKAQTQEAVFSPRRERELLDKWREQASALGVDPALAQDLIRRVLRNSYGGSDSGHYPRLLQDEGKVLIIGGNGGMGRIFRDYFTRSGYRVECFGHRGWPQAQQYFAGALVVIVTVPIDLTEQIIEQAAPYLTERMILCDFTSIKQKPVEVMLRCHKGAVLGLHPMFGPDVASLVKQVIVTVPARQAQRSAPLVEQFKLWGAKICQCEAAEHDRLMAIIQALRHFTTYAYGLFLSSLKPDLKELLELSSPIYRLELMMVGRLFAQDPRLYADIIMSSERNYELISSYAEVLRQELDTVARRDSSAFTERFLQAREFFGDYAGEFLHGSARLLAKMQDER